MLEKFQNEYITRSTSVAFLLNSCTYNNYISCYEIMTKYLKLNEERQKW